MEGLGGDDWLWSRAGDDHLLGGEGNDVLQAEGGSDLLEGEGGNDLISVSQPTHAGELITARGGAGEDVISFSLFGAGGGVIEADGGDGDDSLWVQGLVASTARLTLGAGRDSIRIGTGYQGLGQSTILATDFATGAAGDRIDWDLYLTRILAGWDPNTNPFAGGYMRVRQVGADTLLEIDTDGAGGSAAFATLLTFQNVVLTALTGENLGGYPRDGGPIVGLSITGGPARDEIRGSAGADLIDGLGGDDQILAGLGDDVLRGGDGDDDLRGEEGDDLIEGGLGADTLWDVEGNDRLYGGDGDDLFLIFEGGTDEAYGEGGNDLLRFSQGSAGPIVGTLVSGGDGDDQIEIQFSTGGGSATFDAGTGADIVTLMSVYQSTAWITLGEGRDVLRLYPTFSYGSGSAIVQDFLAGAAGDVIDWMGFLGSELAQWDGAANPFATGHFRLVQSGADTRLEIDNDGADPWGNGSYELLLTLRNVNAGQLTAANFGGFAPDGSASAPLTLTGTAAGERLEGATGSDDIDGAGGNDTIVGGAGHDLLRGGDADDTISGDLGNDRLEGGGGADVLGGGSGTDQVHGGEGDDRLTSSAGATDELHGEAGNDTLIVAHSGGGNPSTTYGDQVLASGGIGNDIFFVRADNRSFITVDGGAGDDIVNLQRSFLATFTITLGAGRDTIAIQSFYAHENVMAAIVTDFTAGPSGDTLDWDQYLDTWLIGWDGTANPFAAGYVHLVRDGADTIVKLDRDAWGSSFAPETVLTLKNVAAAGFGAANFDGYDPHALFAVTGTDGVDTLNGTPGRDTVNGLGGNDLIRLNQGGDDRATGGAGNDVFYFGGAFTALDRPDGGDGQDSVVLQGNHVLTLSNSSLIGIETLSLASGADPSFGDTAGNFYDFNITTLNGNVAPGGQMIVNASSLRAGEDFTFNGSAETDGKFLIYGGHGVDNLKGGGLGDVFFFEGGRWGPNDRVDGRGGGDSVVISAGGGLNRIEFGAGQLTNIESVLLANQYASDPSQKPSYDLVFHSGSIASSATLVVNGSSIPAGQLIKVDGRALLGGKLILLGSGGNDTLSGGGGSDTIVGGGRSDSMAGRGGADVFRYDAVTDSTSASWDLIGDFQVGVDKIDLSRIDANSHAAGNQAFHWIGSNAFAGTGAASAGELRVYADAGRWWAAGDVDGNGVADLVIALTPQGAILPGQGDFLL